MRWHGSWPDGAKSGCWRAGNCLEGLDPACYFPLQEVGPALPEALFTLYDSTTLPMVVINTIGLLHDLAHMPERRVEEVTPMARRESAGQCLAPPGPWCQPQPAHDAPEHALALQPLGSGGSLEEGQEAMCHYSYRMSKAALNMGIPDPGG